MSNARDKANIPALNFSSTGIDDNATSTAITIDSNQDVGIGTTNAFAKLVVEGDSNSNVAVVNAIGTAPNYIFDARDDGTSVFRIDGSGNVGIGTSSPSVTLDVRSTSVNTIRLSREGTAGSGGNASLLFEGREPTLGTGKTEAIYGGTGSLYFFTGGTSGDLSGGSERMRIDSSGNVGINQSSPGQKLDVQGIVQVKTATSATRKYRITDSVTGQYFDMGVSISSSQPNLTFSDGADERMRINSSGQLLIGTTVAPSNADTKLRVHTPIASSSRKVIELSHNTNGANKAGAALGLSISNGGEATNAATLTFQTASGGSLGERMRILPSGNVGIGNTNPSSTLHISGDPQVTLTQPNNLVLQNDTDSATSGDAKTGILFRANYNGTTPTDLANITAGKENATNNNFASFIGLCTRTNGVNTLVERMRVTQSAVFINTTSEPSQGDNGVQISATDVYHVFL